MSCDTRPRVLIVGAFTVGAEGRTGGTLTACRQLVASPISQLFDLVLVDTTARTEAERRSAVRAAKAFWRLLGAVWLALTGRLSAALLFSANGLSWLERCTLAILFRIAGIRVLLFPRTGLVVEELESSRGLRFFSALAVRSSAAILCQGQSFGRRFAALIPAARDKLHVIPNWVAPEAMVPPNRVAHEGVTVAFIGWLEKYKAVDVLIDAVTRHVADFASCRFIICGDGPERVDLEKRAAGLSFEFRGWIDDVQKRATLEKSDILVLPSRVEGMPNVLLEAMTAGLPVVSTTVGCIPDLVTDGEEGFLVPPGDVESLARALVALVNDAALRARMGMAGRERILRDHVMSSAWRRIALLLIPGITLPGEDKA